MKYFEAGKKFKLEGNDEQARRSFEKAAASATESGDIRDLVLARMELTNFYSRRRESGKLEEFLLDSLKICRGDQTCRGKEFEYSFMSNIYDDLSFIYVFELKDKEKLKWLLQDVASNEKYYGASQTREMVCKYVNEIAQTQFSDVSEEYNKQYRCEDVVK